MRVAKRNMQKAYYQLQTGTAPQYDRSGQRNGNVNYTYGAKTEFWANIYKSGRDAYYQPYGTVNDYSLSLYMSELPDGWNEQTILWIGNTDKANYIVSSIAVNMNGVAVFAKELK